MLSEMSVDKLKEKAKGLGISGYASMKKAELINAIEAKDEKLASAIQSEQLESEKSSAADVDLASHPKFAKFN